jgi:hypothetical protein
MGNLEDPGTRRSFGPIKSLRVAMNYQENILDQVIGFRGIANGPIGDRPHGPRISAEQDGKRFPVSFHS